MVLGEFCYYGILVLYTYMNKKIIVWGIAAIALAALIIYGIYVWLVMI